MIANHDEVSFGLLRYFLGGYRPSKTAHLALSTPQIHGVSVRFPFCQDQYFNVDSIVPNETTSQSPGYPTHDKTEANTKVQ
jgi:hypothetical protein